MTRSPWARPRAVLVPRTPSFSVSERRRREVLSAGASPDTIPASSERETVKIRTRVSRCISAARGKVVGNIARAALVPQLATTNPSPPPVIASSRLSIRDCRSSRHRPAPSAARIVNSRIRPVERTSNRLLTFTQAISKTKPTAPSSSHRVGPMPPIILALSEKILASLPLLVSG